jgi:phytoene dehydrogenase-like protein
MTSPESVATTIVVGGGIAGLMCARELSRAGHRVLLLEQSDAVGGRVRTTQRNGFLLDHGFQVLFTAYPTLAAALDLKALQLQEFQPAARIAGVTATPSLIGDALADLSLLLPTLRAPALSLPDKLRMLRLRYSATSMSFDACFRDQFDRRSTREYLRRKGFSERAIAQFFAPFYGGILLDRSLSTSASVLLYTFKMLAEGRTAVPAAGMGAIAEQLASQLAAGTVRTNARVARVTCTGRGVTGVTLTSGESLAAHAVILACDPPTIGALTAAVGAPVTVPIAQLGCSTVYLASREALLHGSALWLNAAEHATVSHAATISNIAPSYAPPGQSLTAATVLGPAAQLDDDTLVARVRDDLCAMSGIAEPVRAAELLAVWRVPYSQYAQPPGSVARRVPAHTAVDGLFIASEAGHTSSLEGAARGGVAAAQAVLRGAGNR